MLMTVGSWVLAQQGQQRPGALMQILFILAIFMIFYFLLIRPKQREQKAQQKMVSELTKGDRVLTSGGMFGSVVGLKDDRVVLRVADNVKLEFLKTAVVRRLGREDS